jgi:hypothetical protein
MSHVGTFRTSHSRYATSVLGRKADIAIARADVRYFAENGRHDGYTANPCVAIGTVAATLTAALAAALAAAFAAFWPP